jgi:hypothetical protein
MKPSARRQVDFRSQNVMQEKFELRKLDEAELHFRITIDEDVDVGTRTSFVARKRTVEIEAPRAERSDGVGMFPNPRYGIFTGHGKIITRSGVDDNAGYPIPTSLAPLRNRAATSGENRNVARKSSTR